MTQVSDVKRRLVSSTMTPSGDIQEWFGRLLLEMAEACGTKISEARARIYAADLADLTEEQIVSAVRYVRRECTSFFPSIAEIRKAALGAPEDRALLAWTSLERAAAKIGAWESWLCEDAWTAHALLQVFGSWGAFCAHESNPELLTKRQAFLAAYRDLRRLMPHPIAPVQIAGQCETAGTYKALWIGRLTLDGRVEHERATALPVPVSAAQLQTGRERASDGEETKSQVKEHQAIATGSGTRPTRRSDSAT